MTIQFPCSQCQTTLSAPDGSTGKKARCPKCGNVQPIPAPEAPSGGAWHPESMPPNPYAAPQSFAPAPMGKAEAGGELVRRRIDFSQLLGDSWQVFQQKLGPLMLLTLIIIAFIIVMLVIDFMLNLVQQGLIFGMGGGRGRLDAAGISVMVVFGFVRQVFQFLVQTWLQYGAILVVLPLIRFNRADYGRFFALGPYYGRALLAQFLMTLLAAAGILVLGLVIGAPAALLAGLAKLPEEQVIILVVVSAILILVPGYVFFIWVFLRLALVPFFILDRNAGVIESFKLSDHYMTGNKLTLFLVYLVVGLVSIPAIYCTCLIGTLFVIPYYLAMTALAYLTATGQWTPGSANPVPQYT